VSAAAIPASAVVDVPVAQRTINPWIIALAVVIPTFMEVLDTTIANVALRYMAGGLSAPATDSEWVITSYLAANAIILPMSGWLAVRLGRRNYFLISIAVFTLASVLCGMATSLGMLIGSRVLQGLAGGGLQPSSQGVLLDAFPREKQGAAQTLFGIAALLAPVVGPTLGGYITDNFGWRWIFYLNLPVGVFAFWMCNKLVHDPPYLKTAQREARQSGAPFDTLGLCLLCLTMISWEIVLSKGQEWDWFGDPFLRVQTLAAIFVVSLGSLIWREMSIAHPLINFRTLADRNFRWCCIIIFCAFASLYANTTSLPALLQSLFGYDATTSGLVLSPAGIGAVMMLFVVGMLLGKGVDARYLIAAGLLVLGIGNFWMSRFTLDISPWDVVWSRIVFIVGLSMLFAPLNVAAFFNIPPHMRAAAVGY
jgi:DHA2 family multidrug resistance protein